MKIKKVTRHDALRQVYLSSPIVQNGLPHVLIHPEVLVVMYDHAAIGHPNEVAGYFVGLPLQDTATRESVTYIEQAIKAITTGSPTYVTMHPESFGDVARACEDSGTILVGYYHSHPGLSVFQSGTDTKNFELYHGEPYKIAVVVDSTLTTRNDLDLTSPWIGFFAWDGEHKPTHLPAENIHLVSERPTLLASQDITLKANATDVGVTIARHVWQASKGLARNAHQFNTRLPIIVLPNAIMEALGEVGELTAPREGVLMGICASFAGYDFVCVTSQIPRNLDTLRALQNGFRSYARPAGDVLIERDEVTHTASRDAHTKGAGMVGIYGTASRLARVPVRHHWSQLLVKAITKVCNDSMFCSEYFVMAVTEEEPKEARTAEPTIRFKVLCNDDRHVMAVTGSQIVTLDAEEVNSGPV